MVQKHYTCGSSSKVAACLIVTENSFLPSPLLVQYVLPFRDRASRARAIIDTIMNLDLLYWASHVSDESQFAQIANEHAHSALKYKCATIGQPRTQWISTPTQESLSRK